MSEMRPFTLRANTAMRVIGLLAVLINGGGFLLLWLPYRDLSHAAKICFPVVLWVPLGTVTMLRVSQVTIDPIAGTIVRRQGILPFARRTTRVHGA